MDTQLSQKEKSHDGHPLSSKARKLLTAVVVFSILAIGVTAYLTYLHFEPTASEFCNLSEKFNCDIVNKSIWSRIDLGFVEVPVSILGLLYYVTVLIVTIGLLKKWKFEKILKWLEPKNVIRILLLMTFLGVIFSLYLTYIEAFKLETYCIFCLSQQVIILILLGLFTALGITTKKPQ